MTNLSVDRNMRIIDKGSVSGKVVGFLDKKTLEFRYAKQQVGFLMLPIKLTQTIEEEVCWLQRELY